MVEESRVGIEKACLYRLRESLLKSETRSTLIHILSRCYEDPNTSRIFSSEPPPPTRPGGSSGEGEKASDGVMKVDGVEDVLIDEVKDDEKPMECSVDEFENMIMDIDIDVDTMEGLFEGNTIDQEALREVEDSLLETVCLGNQVAESRTNENGFSRVVEVGLAEGEVVRCDNRDDKFLGSQERRLERPDNVLECGDAQRTVGNDQIEEGEIDKVPVENEINTMQHNETGVDQLIDTKQRKLPGEVSCSEFSNSVFVGVVDKGSKNYHQTSSDACVENLAVISTSEAKTNASTDSVINVGLRCPVDCRSQVFYGDILGEAPPPAQGDLKTDADQTKKRKRGGNSKEKKKIQKRKKRAETDKKHGVKRLKLQQPLKPKVVKVCEHYLKGRCLKGEACPFSHDATPLTKSKACVHFARGNCMKGEACPYDHELLKYPCDSYASKGFCSRGSSCLFSHEIPAKEGSPRASVAEKASFLTTPFPGSDSKDVVNSSTKLSVNTPMQVPKGLSFLSFGKSGSDQLTRPDPSRFPQKVELTGSNPSKRNAPGVDKTVTSIPFATPVRSNNHPYLEFQSDGSRIRKNSVPKACSSEKRVDSTNPMDQALLGINSLVSSMIPVNRFRNECRPGLLEMEHNPPVSRFSGLNMHQSLGLSADKEKYGLEVVNPKGQTSKSSSQVVSNMGDAAHAKESGIYCFSSKTSTVKPIEKLITTIPKDQKSGKILSIQDRQSQSINGNPLAINAQELKSPTSVVSPSSQGLAVNKTMPPSSQGMAVNQAMPASVQEPFLSTSTLASRFESEAKGSSLGSAGSSEILAKPEIASSSKSSSNFRPVKASAILDFIFGTGPKPSHCYQKSAGHLVIIIKFVTLLCAAYFASKAGVPGFGGSDYILQYPLSSRDETKAMEYDFSHRIRASRERILMDFEYELLKEFDRVVSQCDQGANIPSKFNVSDNAGGSEEQGSMMLCITGGHGEAGSNVTSPVDVMNESEDVMKLALAEQNVIQPSSFPPEELNTPQPVNWKMDKGVPHFLSKIYRIVDDPMTDHLVHWGLEGKSFIVQDAATFCNVVLPKYFKHGNFSSFIRQLNTYGFRKIDCDKWEFATREFQRGRIDQLKYIKRIHQKKKKKYIKRRTSITKQMGIRSGKHDEKFQKRLKNLSTQISNLSQQVEVSSSIISAYKTKVQDIELKYKLMASVLSKTIQNPGFVAELIERKASILSKNGSNGETKTPSDQKPAEAHCITKLPSETIHLLPDFNAAARSPNQSEMQLTLCMSTPSIGESSCSPNDSLGSMQNALMNEMEPSEGLTSEKCVLYFHELASLIPADELDGSWVSYANPHVDKKPKLKSEEAHGC